MEGIVPRSKEMRCEMGVTLAELLVGNNTRFVRSTIEHWCKARVARSSRDGRRLKEHSRGGDQARHQNVDCVRNPDLSDSPVIPLVLLVVKYLSNN